MSAQPPPGPTQPTQVTPVVVAPDQPEQDLTLEIHHLYVIGGDATAIVVRDNTEKKIKYKVLIDAGAEKNGSAFLAPYITTYLGGTDNFDLIIATHYHQDHIHGFTQAKIKFKRYMDNGGYAMNKQQFAPRNGTGLKGGSPLFKRYTRWIGENKATREPIPFIEKSFDLENAVPHKVELGSGTGIFLTCYCANGILANGTDVIQKQKEQKPDLEVDPNDVSLALVLEWGDFRYFTAGDLSGDPHCASYFNVEKELIEYLTDTTKGPLKDKPITVLKVSHHGSEHSNQVDLFKKLNPETIIVSCNLIKKVPHPDFLTRLKSFLQNTSKTVVFGNDLHVGKGGKKDKNWKERLAALKALKQYIAEKNLNFTQSMNQQEDILASNRHVHAIVIRRRQPGKESPADPQGQNAHSIKKGTYDILMRIPMQGEQGQSAASAEDVAKNYANVLAVPFEVTKGQFKAKVEIGKGFRLHAQAIIKWLNKDKQISGTTGRDYVKKFYPALDKTIDDHYKTIAPTDAELENKLVLRMQDLFDKTFILGGTLDNPLYVVNWDKFDYLEDKEQDTIERLLRDNMYQQTYNLLVNTRNCSTGWEKESAWNYGTEPYDEKETDEQKKKRKHVPRLEPNTRARKRAKTSSD